MKSFRPWRATDRRQEFEHPLLTIESVTVQAEADVKEVLAMHPSDWVNVIAQAGDEIVFVRQWRFGVQEPTLEIPGGVVDPGESALAAAQRELLEETGYRSSQWSELGWVHPNPALQSNRCTSFLAEDCEAVAEPTGDGDEEIDIVLIPRTTIASRIRDGSIRHALVLAAFHFSELGR